MATRFLTKELWSMLEKTPERERSSLIQAFVSSCAAKGQLRKVREIAADLELWAAERGELKIKTVSRKEEPSVIGGAKVSKGFTSVDATVRGRLQQLRQTLNPKP